MSILDLSNEKPLQINSSAGERILYKNNTDLFYYVCRCTRHINNNPYSFVVLENIEDGNNILFTDGEFSTMQRFRLSELIKN